MSITNTNSIESPATKYWEWKNGEFNYYLKEAKENRTVPSLKFIVLNQTSFVSGWHDKSESGIYSNFVQDLKNQKLTVKSFKGYKIAEGFYSEIKEKLEGGRFTKGIFIWNLEDKQIQHLSIKGGALTALISLKPRFKDGFGYSVTKNPVQQKKGATKFWIPEFTKIEVDVADYEEALEAGKIVDKYISEYFDSKKIESQQEAVVDELDGQVFEDPNVDDFITPDLDFSMGTELYK